MSPPWPIYALLFKRYTGNIDFKLWTILCTIDNKTLASSVATALAAPDTVELVTAFFFFFLPEKAGGETGISALKASFISLIV